MAWPRWTRWLAAALAGIVLLAAMAVGALWWWAGSEGSLAWTLERLARSGALTAEGAKGSLRAGLQVERLVWRKDGLWVEARDVELAWQPLALLRARLQLDHARAGTLRVEDARPPAPGPREAPQALGLPLRVGVDKLAVGRVEWVAAGSAFEAVDLAGRYDFDGQRHQVLLDSLRMLGGSYRGEATVGTAGGLPVRARLEGRLDAALPGSPHKLPLAFIAGVEGPLADLQLEARLSATPLNTTGSPTGSVTAAPPQATVTARLTPWAPQPVPQGRAELRDVDLGALWPQAPHTRLTGQVRLQPEGTASWSVTADLANASPGPWDHRQLPLQSVQAEGQWRLDGQALVRMLRARLGGGTVVAEGHWREAGGWLVEARLQGIDPAALHSELAAVPLAGSAQAAGAGEAIDFKLDLQAAGTVPRRARRGGTDVQAALLELRQATAQGRWDKGALSLPQLRVRTADAQLDATAVQWRMGEHAGSGRASLDAPGLQVRAEGRIAEAAGGGTLKLVAGDLGRAMGWLRRVPGTPDALRDLSLAGRADGQLAWQGGWRDPALEASASVPLLIWRPSAASTDDVAWTVRNAALALEGRLAQARVRAHAQAQQGQRRLAVDLAGQGGRRDAGAGVWQGQLDTLRLAAADPSIGPGSWTLALQRGLELRWAGASERFDAGAGEAVLAAPARAPAGGGAAVPSQALLAWEPVRWGAGELRSAGRVTGLPIDWLELLGGPQLAGAAVGSDLVFDAQWDASLGAVPRLRASLSRSRGDIAVRAETMEGGSARVPAGVREARLSLTSEGEAVTLALRWDSERAGSAEGSVGTRLTRGGAAGWQWPQAAPLAGRLRAQLPRIGVWSLLAPPGWRLRGSLQADLSVAGTRANPQLSGTLAADDVALRSVVDGVELQGGRLRARLAGQQVRVEEFVLRGGGTDGTGGLLRATGEGSWAGGAPQVRMDVQLERLRASVRADRQLTVSGRATARLDGQALSVTGKLRADQARIELPEETAPRLGSDVVVRNAPGSVKREEAKATETAQRAQAPNARRVDLAVDLDLGDDFRIQGRGIATRLAGTLALSGTMPATRLEGTIATVGGEYQAYGQRLALERGLLRFTGPLDNPALDILAVRPRLAQRVGVQVTGRAQAPYVRLYAEPELPDAEKLSWLVLGRAAPAGGAEAALVQQAAVALLASRARGGGPAGPGIAGRLGLDELSFRRDGADGPAVILGKRFASNLYASYERSLSGALGTLYLFYDLSRRFTVRAQTGERTAVDLIFTFSFD